MEPLGIIMILLSLVGLALSLWRTFVNIVAKMGGWVIVFAFTDVVFAVLTAVSLKVALGW